MQAASLSINKPGARAAAQRRARGFTLIEILVAMAVLVTVMAIIVSAFSAVMNGWDRGRRALDGLRRGEYVMEQMVEALHSAMVSGAAKKAGAYSFEVGNVAANVPVGSLSWVTTSSAFLPPHSWLENVPHRLALSVEPQANGELALMARAWPYLADTNTVDLTPGFIAPAICGLACQVYNYDTQLWDDEWAASNNLPAQVQITLYVTVADRVEPMVLQRLVEIPLGVTNSQQSADISTFPAPTTSGSSGGGGGTGAGTGTGGGSGSGARKSKSGGGSSAGGSPAMPPGPKRK